MSVSTEHPEYRKMKAEWLKVRALTAGQRELKSPDVLKMVLPNPDPQDLKRYSDYSMRAIYTNFTGRTKIGLSGAAFRKEPTVALEGTVLEYLEEDCNGKGLKLVQMAKDILGDLFSSGREILLVDFPPIDDELTAEESQEMYAVILRYSALDMINWGPNFITLREWYNASENEFEHEMKEQHRVLRITDGKYTQQLYRDEEPVTEERIITDYTGAPFDFIPLVAIGSQNNDIGVDEIPLADIAHVNEGHFRNSADLEENCFVHSAMTLGVAADMEHDTWAEANPNGVVVGARRGVFLGPKGRFDKVQADPNNLADALMLRKEQQMIQLGARIVENRDSVQTATAARIDATGSNSVLADLVGNTEDGILKAIEWCGMFMGVAVSGDEFKMNREFFESSVDPQAAIAAMQYYDRGLIGKPDIIQVGRKAGFVDEDTTDEDLLNGMSDPGLMTNSSLPTTKESSTVNGEDNE